MKTNVNLKKLRDYIKYKIAHSNKMEPEGILFGFSFAMLVGAYVAGNIPLSFHLSESKLVMISALGCGLLIGTALSVIIPEGIETLYSIPDPGPHLNHIHSHEISRRVDSFAPQTPKQFNDNLIRRQDNPSEETQDNPLLSRDKDAENEREIAPPIDVDATSSTSSTSSNTINSRNFKKDDLTSSSPSCTNSATAHSTVGMSLTLGFLFMLLIDQVGGGGHGTAASASNASGSSGASDLISVGSGSASGGAAVAAGGTGGARRSLTTTIGLVVHSAADGIALGSAVNSSKAELEFLVFLAIMLHKAPAAFGLTSFLLHEGFDRSTIRKHLLIFSSAAPIMSFVTYILLNHSGKCGCLSPFTVWFVGVVY